MLKFIQYNLWYSFLVGLLNMTVVVIYAFTWCLNNSQFAYITWFMVIGSIGQYTGNFGMFQNVLQNLQYYGKIELLNFLGGNIWNNITQFIFLFIGRLWGIANPGIGEIMGIAIFYSFCGYISSIPNWILGIYYFKKIMKNLGIGVGDCFHHDFSWADMKECVTYNLKTGISGIITSPFGLLNWWIWILCTAICIIGSDGGSRQRDCRLDR